MECRVTQEVASLLYASFISYITMRISRILPPWLFLPGATWVFLEDSPSSSTSSPSSSSLFSSQLPEEVPICYVNEPWPWFAHQVPVLSCSQLPVPWALIVLVLRPGLVHFTFLFFILHPRTLLAFLDSIRWLGAFLGLWFLTRRWLSAVSKNHLWIRTSEGRTVSSYMKLLVRYGEYPFVPSVMKNITQVIRKFMSKIKYMIENKLIMLILSQSGFKLCLYL